MTKRAEKINEYYRRLSILDSESEKYEEVYKEFMKFLNNKENN